MNKAKYNFVLFFHKLDQNSCRADGRGTSNSGTPNISSRPSLIEYIHKSIIKWLTCQRRRSAVSSFTNLTFLNNLVLLVVYIN